MKKLLLSVLVAGALTPFLAQEASANNDGSVVDWLEANEMYSDFDARGNLAEAYGLVEDKADYKGTAKQNVALLDKLQSGAAACEPDEQLAEDYSCVDAEGYWTPEEPKASTTTESAGTNVGDGETYTYEITEVEGDRIHGEPANKSTAVSTNGILLFKDEVTFEVNPEDVIDVVWGEYEDEFKSIEKSE